MQGAVTPFEVVVSDSYLNSTLSEDLETFDSPQITDSQMDAIEFSFEGTEEIDEFTTIISHPQQAMTRYFSLQVDKMKVSVNNTGTYKFLLKASDSKETLEK